MGRDNYDYNLNNDELRYNSHEKNRYPRTNYHGFDALSPISRNKKKSILRKYSYIWVILAIAIISIAIFSVLKHLPNAV